MGDGRGRIRDPVRGPVQSGLSRQALTRKFRRSPVQPPSAAGASLTHVVHSRPGLRSVVGRLRPGRLLAPASRRRFALHDGWTTRISPRGAAARWSRALSTLRPPPPGAIGGDPLHVAAHERGHAPPRASSPACPPSRTPPTRRTHAIRARPSGRARPRRPRRPTLPAPCRGRPARPRGTARSIPDLQAFLLCRAVLLLHLREQRLGLVHFLPVGLRLRRSASSRSIAAISSSLSGAGQSPAVTPTSHASASGSSRSTASRVAASRCAVSRSIS